MSSLSSSSIFRNNFPSTSITSSTLSVPALRCGTNFARLLSRWKIFQVAHFAQKTRFRFGLKFLAQKRSLLSLGIKRGATRSIMVKTTCVQKKRAGVSFLDGSQTFCGRREEKKLYVAGKCCIRRWRHQLPYSIDNNSFHLCQH